MDRQVHIILYVHVVLQNRLVATYPKTISRARSQESSRSGYAIDIFLQKFITNPTLNGLAYDKLYKK